MAKRGIVLRHWDSRMLSDPIKNKWDQPLHPALLQAQLKPIQKQLRFVAAPESGCLVSFIEPFSYLSGTLFVPWKAVLLILWSPPPICLLCSSIFSVPQRCLYFDSTFNFSDLEADGFPDNLSLLILKTTSLWTLCLILVLAWLFSVWSLLLQSSDQALQEMPYLWMSYAKPKGPIGDKPKKSLWFVFKTLEINS